jgi:hypothetical protein
LAFHSGRETDHSPPSSAEVKEWVELYLHSPNTPSWFCAQLGGAQGQLYLYNENFICSILLLCDNTQDDGPVCSVLKELKVNIAYAKNTKKLLTM